MVMASAKVFVGLDEGTGPAGHQLDSLRRFTKDTHLNQRSYSQKKSLCHS
jgi:hypothetical protein